MRQQKETFKTSNITNNKRTQLDNGSDNVTSKNNKDLSYTTNDPLSKQSCLEILDTQNFPDDTKKKKRPK